MPAGMQCAAPPPSSESRQGDDGVHPQRGHSRPAALLIRRARARTRSGTNEPHGNRS
jgi:hypothetical protein